MTFKDGRPAGNITYCKLDSFLNFKTLRNSDVKQLVFLNIIWDYENNRIGAGLPTCCLLLLLSALTFTLKKLNPVILFPLSYNLPLCYFQAMFSLLRSLLVSWRGNDLWRLSPRQQTHAGIKYLLPSYLSIWFLKRWIGYQL